MLQNPAAPANASKALSRSFLRRKVAKLDAYAASRSAVREVKEDDELPCRVKARSIGLAKKIKKGQFKTGQTRRVQCDHDRIVNAALAA